ncbi:hypothetical protein CCMA1212_007518 [Trichoderma ghanense]|uniref:Uncharacterized protein n=1 Tax=Trichoderma ghanense TaxID=65468 RepID=A0ABY2GXQ5_9HYPO
MVVWSAAVIVVDIRLDLYDWPEEKLRLTQMQGKPLDTKAFTRNLPSLTLPHHGANMQFGARQLAVPPPAKVHPPVGFNLTNRWGPSQSVPSIGE